MSKKLKLVYVYDPLCSWCFAFSTVVKKLIADIDYNFDIEVLSGGMVLGGNVTTGKQVKAFVGEGFKQMEQTSGIKISEAFTTKLLEGDAVFSSERGCLALTAFKLLQPEGNHLDFAHAIQKGIYEKGLGSTDDELFKYVAQRFEVDESQLLKKMEAYETKMAFNEELNMVKTLNVSGFPHLFIADDLQYYLVAKGYTSFENISAVVNSVLTSIFGSPQK
jgi:putative protein-disulfide isomerase